MSTCQDVKMLFKPPRFHSKLCVFLPCDRHGFGLFFPAIFGSALESQTICVLGECKVGPKNQVINGVTRGVPIRNGVVFGTFGVLRTGCSRSRKEMNARLLCLESQVDFL